MRRALGEFGQGRAPRWSAGLTYGPAEDWASFPSESGCQDSYVLKVNFVVPLGARQ